MFLLPLSMRLAPLQPKCGNSFKQKTSGFLDKSTQISLLSYEISCSQSLRSSELLHKLQNICFGSCAEAPVSCGPQLFLPGFWGYARTARLLTSQRVRQRARRAQKHPQLSQPDSTHPGSRAGTGYTPTGQKFCEPGCPPASRSSFKAISIRVISAAWTSVGAPQFSLHLGCLGKLPCACPYPPNLARTFSPADTAQLQYSFFSSAGSAWESACSRSLRVLAVCGTAVKGIDLAADIPPPVHP